MKALTPHMKTVLIDLYTVVLDYDNGVPLQPHDVRNVHHKILRGLDSRKLIILKASYSPSRVIWTVALTPKGIREAKRLAKEKQVINDHAVNESTKKKKLPRKLKTIQWQLNVNDKKGAQLYKDAKAMKKDPKQSFTKTMSLLMELHKELKAGQVGLLQKLYPEAYATMLLIARNELEMEREWKVEGLLEDFKRHMLSQNISIPANLPLSRDFDDDSDTLLMTVQKDANAGKQSAENFLKSVMALNPEPVVEDAPRKLDVPTFEAPDFDEDLDEDLFG